MFPTTLSIMFHHVDGLCRSSRSIANQAASEAKLLPTGVAFVLCSQVFAWGVQLGWVEAEDWNRLKPSKEVDWQHQTWTQNINNKLIWSLREGDGERETYLIIKMCKTSGFRLEALEQTGDRTVATGKASDLTIKKDSTVNSGTCFCPYIQGI